MASHIILQKCKCMPTSMSKEKKNYNSSSEFLLYNFEVLAPILTEELRCQWLHFSRTRLHYIYCDMWPFPLVNVTQTIGGNRENRITHCAPVRNCEKWKESASTVFLSPALGFITSQNTHLLKLRENTLTLFPTRVYACTWQHTHTHTPPPFLHILRGEVRLSALWGSRPVFPLGWHPAHVNSPSLQKPLMQGPALTVFWQWVTICQPWPLSDCRSHWKTDLWREQRLI